MSERETLRRQWQILTMLPRYPAKLEAREIQRRLAKAGFSISKRSVERDLQNLSTVFPIASDERERPYGWSWQKNAPAFNVPGLTAPQALAFVLARRYLAQLLPKSALAELEPHFALAEATLRGLGHGHGASSWSDKVRVVLPTQALLPPVIHPDVQRVVYEALLEGRQLKVVYHKRGDASPSEYTVHPLGLIQRGSVFYLVCTLFRYRNIKLLVLHRILSAIMLDEPIVRPRGFDLDFYARSGALDFGTGKRVHLEAMFAEDAAAHLYETPLSADQMIKPAADGMVRIVATVNDTPQLYWWLLGFGDQVEVIRPKSLRDEMIRIVRAAARRYPGR